MQRIRISSERGVYPICASCRAVWKSGENPCDFCLAGTTTVQVTAVVTLRRTEGADIRAFCDIFHIAKILRIEGDSKSFLEAAGDLSFLEKTTDEVFSVILTERTSRVSTKRADVVYNVESVLRPGELHSGNSQSSRRKKRR